MPRIAHTFIRFVVTTVAVVAVAAGLGVPSASADVSGGTSPATQPSAADAVRALSALPGVSPDVSAAATSTTSYLAGATANVPGSTTAVFGITGSGNNTSRADLLQYMGYTAMLISQGDQMRFVIEDPAGAVMLDRISVAVSACETLAQWFDSLKSGCATFAGIPDAGPGLSTACSGGAELAGQAVVAECDRTTPPSPGPANVVTSTICSGHSCTASGAVAGDTTTSFYNVSFVYTDVLGNAVGSDIVFNAYASCVDIGCFSRRYTATSNKAPCPAGTVVVTIDNTTEYSFPKQPTC